MGQEEYNRYVAAFQTAENIFRFEGDTERYREAEDIAEAHYEAYEYAVGLRTWDYD